MKVPQFDLTRQYSDIKNEIGAQIDRILSSGKVILGENVAEIEKEVANYVGVKFAVGVASGSDALLIGLRALGVEPMWNIVFPKDTFRMIRNPVTLLTRERRLDSCENRNDKKCSG